MTTRHRALARLMTGLLLLAPAALPAAAQTKQAAVSAPAPTPANRSAAIERRITDLRNRLKITPAEQKPFDDFAQVMRDGAQRMSELMQKSQANVASGSAVDQMRSYTDMAQAHADNMQHLTAAFSTLYDSLSPDQKKAADESFRQFATNRRLANG